MNNKKVTVTREEFPTAIKEFFNCDASELFTEECDFSNRVFGKNSDEKLRLYEILDELDKDNHDYLLATITKAQFNRPNRERYAFFSLGECDCSAAPKFFAIKIKDFFEFMSDYVDRNYYEMIYDDFIAAVKKNCQQIKGNYLEHTFNPDANIEEMFRLVDDSYTYGALIKDRNKNESDVILYNADKIMRILVRSTYKCYFHKTPQGIEIKPECTLKTI